MLFVDFKFFILLSSFITVFSGLECKENEARAQKYENVAVQSNGCSKPSFIQVADEEDFTYCCDRHDACYATCNAPKDFCDDDFLKCMKNLCRKNFASNK